MDFTLPNEIKIVQRSAREFAEKRVVPLVPEMEETGKFPEQLIPELAELGILGIITPEEYGGSNLGFLARTVAIAEISKVSAALGLVIQVHHMEVGGLVEFGTSQQKEKYLPPLAKGDYLGVCAVTEPTGGSDLLGMATIAQAEPDGYIINGRKCFITNAHYAGAPMIIAKTGGGPRGLSAFVIDKETPGFSPGRSEHKLGLRGADTGELFMKDCKVSRENLLDEEGAGLKVALNTISEVGRPGMAAIALGIIEASLAEAVKFAKGRKLYGRPISKLGAIQWYIADIYTLLETARWLCYHASWLKDEGKECAVAMTLAKTYTTDAAVSAAKMAIEVHGGAGAMMEYPVQRYFRDAMVCISSGGTKEIGKVVLSRAALS